MIASYNNFTSSKKKFYYGKHDLPFEIFLIWIIKTEMIIIIILVFI